MRPTATADGGRNGEGSVPQPHAGPPPGSGSKARSLRVAVADGDPAAGPFYLQSLPALGYQVFVVQTGGQLVEACRLLRPDLVVAGGRLPDLDGVAAAAEACRDRPTPIILVASEQEAESVRRALPNPHVLACLFKPLKEADLGAAIAVAMSRFEQLESVRKEAADLRQALEDRKLVERAKGLVMRYTGLNEEEAHYRLRKMASDQNRKLAEVAQAIRSAGEVFQQLERTTAGDQGKNGRAWDTGKSG